MLVRRPRGMRCPKVAVTLRRLSRRRPRRMSVVGRRSCVRLDIGAGERSEALESAMAPCSLPSSYCAEFGVERDTWPPVIFRASTSPKSVAR